MLIKEIYGDNYSGKYVRTRTACRAIITDNGKILLSYAKAEDVWMLPGGGLENNESFAECCIREAAEETGYVIEPSDCVLQINEYYEDCRYVSKYFFAAVIGNTDVKLTEAEIKAELVPQWIPINAAVDIFSKHALYADSFEMKRGLYLREFTALKELLK